MNSRRQAGAAARTPSHTSARSARHHDVGQEQIQLPPVAVDHGSASRRLGLEDDIAFQLQQQSDDVAQTGRPHQEDGARNRALAVASLAAAKSPCGGPTIVVVGGIAGGGERGSKAC